jgi:hypothetical protein
MPELTSEQIHNAVRNEYPDKSFQLGDRTFPVKDLSYDDYLEFCDLARPIIESVVGIVDLSMADGKSDVEFNPAGLDFNQIIKLAGKELPRMAWICCRQSDPNITIDEVKRLARRPMALLTVVLAQVQHNQMVQEFVDFFQSLAQRVSGLAPELAQAAKPTKL